MGDSITHGVVTNGYDNVPQLFAKYLDELGRKDDVVINTGVSNATIATTLDQIETRLKRYQPDVAVIMLGTNDCAKMVKTTSQLPAPPATVRSALPNSRIVIKL